MLFSVFVQNDRWRQLFLTHQNIKFHYDDPTRPFRHFDFVIFNILYLENGNFQNGVFSSMNKGSYGSKKPEIVNMLGFGPSHKQIEQL